VDKLAKQGGALQQEDLRTTYELAKTIIKNYLSSKWEKEHPAHKRGVAYHQLSRQAQVTIFRLRTGHIRLRYHMFHKYKIGETICVNVVQHL
jgi:lambda repressor-like predicted transcriptional regulator